MEVNVGLWKKKKGNMLRMFDRRILRMIYGTVNDIGIWRTG